MRNGKSLFSGCALLSFVLIFFPALALGQAGKKATPAKAGGAATASKPWLAIRKPPLPPFHPQQPQRVELPNGMVLFLQEDHELPLIDGSIRIRGGSREEPGDKVGLINIYGHAWRTGGTKSRTGDQLDDFLEIRAAKVETGGGIDSTTLSWSSLKPDFDDVFRVVVELLRQPEFRQDKIDLAKQQLDTAISRRNDDISAITERESTRLGYGRDNAYARIPEYYTVAAVTRDELLQWHNAYLHPNNMILGVVGDFDPKTMEATLRRAFESWPKGPAAQPAKVELHHPSPGVYFIEKEDVNQSELRLVTLGTRRDNPDYFAIQVMNEVLSGGAASRMFSNLRSKQGLAYAVGGGLRAAYDHPGLFRVGLGTKSETTAAALRALREELERLVKSPPTDAEIKRAQDSILNSFVFNFDSKEKVLEERMAYEFYGYPADFLERYRAGIEKTTREEVERVANKYVHPDRMAVLVVGKSAEFDKPLSSFGPVSTIDVTIPQSAPGKKPETAEAPTASNPEGKALMAKVLQALGGEARLQSVKAIRQKASQTRITPQGEVALETDVIIVYPDRLHVTVETPMGEMQQVISPQSAFMSMAGQARDMPASMKVDALKDLRRDPVYVAQHISDPKFTFAGRGAEKIGDLEARVLEIDADGAPTRWSIDPATGHVLRASYRTTGMAGPADQVIEYSDWRSVDGLNFAFRRKVTQNGQPFSSVEVKEIQVNPTVDPKLFEKPPEKSF